MNITVFLGAKSGNDPIYTEAVHELGAWIAGNGHTLIYGGSSVGLMGALSDAVKENGGRIIGIGVKVEKILKVRRSDLDEYVEAENVQIRKELMVERSDAFIAIPGSLGTLDEITDVMAAVKLKLLCQPCILYNLKGYYEPLKAMLQKMMEEGFLSDSEVAGVTFADTFEDIVAALQ